jgi:hypothetical protein
VIDNVLFQYNNELFIEFAEKVNLMEDSEIIRQHGKGSFGEVYLAKCLIDELPAAIKIVNY